MKCEFCGSEGVDIRGVTRTYGKGEDLLLIENIPAIGCPHCGDYLTAETLHEIERIKSDRKMATIRFVEVANFGEENPLAV